MTFRLFLSHSTPVEERVNLDRLIDALHARSGGAIVVLCDRDQIRGGDDWRARIGYLLHACDGAALLLDGRALRSKWVLAEATFLSIRALYDSRFRLVPVSLTDGDELSRHLNAPKWKPADLPGRQFVSGSDPSDLAKAIWDGLVSNGRLPIGRSLVERLADQMATHMQNAPRGALRELADELGDDIPYDDVEDRYRSALVIARHAIADASLYRSRDSFDKLGPDFVARYARRLLELLAPLPYDASAAALLRRCREGGGPAPVLMQCRDPRRTAPLYVRRAYLPDSPPEFIELPPLIDGTTDDVRRALRIAARDMLWPDRADELPDEEVQRRLRRSRRPLFALTTPVDAVVLEELSEEYPMVGFVFHHREDTLCDPVGPTLRVVPRLSPERELALLDEQDDVLRGLPTRSDR